jgi:hypothetical protein
MYQAVGRNECRLTLEFLANMVGVGSAERNHGDGQAAQR